MRPPARAHRVERGRRLGAHAAALGMHAVVGGVRRLDRQKGAGPHMQGHPVQRDAARLQGRDQLRREMQARGRRRDRAFLAREHGLIVVAVVLVGLAAATRYRAATAWSPRSSIAWSSTGAVEREGERHLAALAFFLDRGVELAEEADLAFAAEADDVADGKPLAGLDEGAPARAVEALVQRRLDGGLGIAAPDPPAAQARRDHLACR